MSAVSKVLTCRQLPVAQGATGAGAKVFVGDMDMSTVAIQVSGTFDATYQVQGSLDGTNWFSVGAAFADAGGLVNMQTDGTHAAASAMWLRVNCPSDYTSGQGAAVVTGEVAKM